MVLALHQAGWSIGDVGSSGPGGASWLVYGTNGANVVCAGHRLNPGHRMVTAPG